MCGIAGYFGQGDLATLERMNAAIKHRGPDDSGSVEIGSVGLTHRRLSIIDTSKAGAQPMASDTVVLSYNGEVYNFNELKEQHLKGADFRGGSDTEVILGLYKRLGTKSFSLLRGMYAFALYDTKINTLFLVRDYFGKKPLYYSTLQSGTLIFGSELKALREHPLCPSELDRDSVASFLCFEYIPTPRSIYAGVHKLPVASYAAYDGNEVIVHSLDPVAIPDLGGSETEMVDTLLKKAVKSRLMSDVPLGVFLSGGLDSSTIAYFAQEATKNSIKTFSVGSSDDSFDERDDAALVAKHLGTDHHAIEVSPAEVMQVVTDIPEILDEPMADSSIVPTSLVSKFAAETVTVCLGGDGADELFHGYGPFMAHRYAQLYRKLPGVVQSSITAVANRLPVSHGYMSLDFKAKRFLQGVNAKEAEQNMRWLAAFQPEVIDEISNNTLPTDVIYAYLDKLHGDLDDSLAQMDAEYRHGYLVDDILVKVDRAGMRYGLEVRAPFLDEDLDAYVTTLDPAWKVRGNTGKFILREVMRDRLPKEVFTKKKQGFNIPVGKWIKTDLQDEFKSVILSGVLGKTGMFDETKIEKLLQEHIDNKIDRRKEIWSLYVLSRWLNRWQ